MSTRRATSPSLNPPRPPRHRRTAASVAASIAVAALVATMAGIVLPVASAPPAAAADGDIFTIAGSTGVSSATHIGMDLNRVLALPTGALVSDSTGHVIRRIDLPAGTQTVIAGNGAFGRGADDVPATTSEMSHPYDMARDGAGNTYIVEKLQRKVRKFTPGGTITTVVGTGGSGSTGDGGPATAATLVSPEGVAVDGVGNLYIADRGANKIRKVTAGGIISTFAGTGTAGFAGDGGAPGAAQLNRPEDVEVSAGGIVYIADTENHRVRAVAGGLISTVAGTGTKGFNGDGGAPTAASLSSPSAVDLEGSSLYIADTWNNRVRKVSGGVITTVAGGGNQYGDGGPATQQSLGRVVGVSAMSSGAFYVAVDTGGGLRRVESNGVITTVGGNTTSGFSGDGGQASSAQVHPGGVAQDAAGNTYIADTWNGRIRKRTSTGLISTVAGGGVETGDGVTATAAALDWPTHVAVLPDGSLIIVDTGADTIRRVSPAGVISTVAGSGVGGFSGDGGPAVNAQLKRPMGIAVDSGGALYVADEDNNRVRRIGPDGIITTVAGSGPAGFSGDNGPATAATLDDPFDVAIDAAGSLLVADTGNHRVRKVTPDGTISTIAGSGAGTFTGDGGPATAAGLYEPAALTVDEGGAIFVATDGRVRRIAPLTTTITTIAGVGIEGYSGDYGTATAARVGTAWDLLVEPDGDLLLADYTGYRVRRVIGAASTGARYHAITPARILDSRNGTGGYATKWGPSTSRDLKVTGVGGVPSTGVTSVILNVTVTDPNATSHLTVWPAGHPRPTASNLNWPAGDTRPNLVTAKVGDGGKVSIFNNSGTVHVIADVVGWYDTGFDPTGHRHTPVSPARILDSRNGTGGYATRWGPATTRDLKVTGVGGVPADASAVALNVTVTDGTTASHLTVWPAGQAKPTVSNLNWPTGATRPNLVIVKVGALGKVSLFNNSGQVHVIADVVGYFKAPTQAPFHVSHPHRLLDSRDGTGGYTTPWGAGTTRSVKVAGVGVVPAKAQAVVLNITVTGASAASHLTTWPSGVPKPTASSLNWAAGETVPNLVVVKVGTDGKIDLFNNAGTVHVIADVAGWYL